jgi:hypothetical protein
VLLLDTNVISELMRIEPHAAVMVWANRLHPDDVGITAMNEAEILHGLALLPMGRRRHALEERWERLVQALFSGRVFPFDRAAAHWYAALLRRRQRLGRPISTADALIAAIALSLGASLATRDTADFSDLGLMLINPWPAP